MKPPKWVHHYLLIIGILLIISGISLMLRTYLEHAFSLGYLIGAGFVFYGMVRLKHRKFILNGESEILPGQ
ncbi:MAG: hypothetical protein M1421_08165 [Candidatus Eremiobacteraeota bacterium]|nr:hypothetical protein [Candidatus Eremiobacteraeota bacterium]MCL5055382.1 hypothetical protein [Bacillota bacterium]